MFKILLVTSFLVAAAYAKEDYENFIDYGLGDSQFQGLATPYVYKYPKESRVIIKPMTPFVKENDSRVLVPEAVGVIELSKIGLVTKAAEFVFALVKKAVAFILINGPALLLGSFVALGLCKFTPVCNKLSALSSIVEVKREISSLATPEHLASATQFVKAAVRKYRSLQDSDDN